MEFIIDRFEGNYAVVELEDGSLENIPIKCLPTNATQGSIIEINVNYSETNSRRNKMKNKMNSIFHKNDEE